MTDISPIGYRIFSFLAVALGGYLSLATTCGSSEFHVDVIGHVSFGRGQTTQSIWVDAEGRELTVIFEEVLSVERDGHPTAPTDIAQNDFYATQCTTSGLSTTCTTLIPWNAQVARSNSAMRFDLTRNDATLPANVTIRASATGGGDCLGNAPERLGVRLRDSGPP